MDIGNMGAAELVAAVRGGVLTVTEVAEQVLARISETEPTLQAWAYFDADQALRTAKILDDMPEKRPLHGIPVGVKDLMDTADMPTEYGSEIYEAQRPMEDALMVARLRDLGAFLVGKTTTTEFACFQPTPTTNPHNAAYTPGGSSSGSAAAVAKGIIHLGLGSQTAASITRPAAYCGVVGYKSSHGRFPLRGIKGLAPTFDSFGWLSRDVRDASYVYGALSAEPVMELEGPLRIALCRTPMWDEAEDAARLALESAARLLELAGHEVSELVLPELFGDLAAAHATIMAAEAARSLHKELACAREMLSEGMRDMLERGRDTEWEKLAAARAVAERCIVQMPAIWDRFDVIVAPSAPGVAPLGLGSTGSPVFSRLWTVLGVPSVAIPIEKNQDDLPVGVQILAPRGQDARLLGMALSFEKALSGRA